MTTMLVKVVTLGSMKKPIVCTGAKQKLQETVMMREDHPEPVEEPAGKSRSWSPTHSVGHQVKSNL